MGRPKIEIDPKLVYELASLGCKNKEIATLVGCSDTTLETRFLPELHKGRENLKRSLRRWQIKSAKAGNVAMLIWLGKQYLEQTDKIDNSVKVVEKKVITYQSEWGSANEAGDHDSDEEA